MIDYSEFAFPSLKCRASPFFLFFFTALATSVQSHCMPASGGQIEPTMYFHHLQIYFLVRVEWHVYTKREWACFSACMWVSKSFLWLTRSSQTPALPAALFSLLKKMLMKNYALFVLVWGENIFHGVVGHKASQILCGEERKHEPLKLFKWFPHCLGLRARLDLFQHTQTEQGPELYMDREVICEGSLVQYMVTNWMEGKKWS